MKYCKNCGHELKPNHKVCTNCGTKVEQKEDQIVTPIQNYEKTQNQTFTDQYTNVSQQTKIQRQPMSKKAIILLSTVIVFIALLALAYFILGQQFSYNNSVTAITNAIQKDDAKQLSDLLKSGDAYLSEEEAKAFIAYNKAKGIDLKTSLLEAKKEIDNNESGTSITHDASEVMNVAKDGKKYGLFDKYSFKVPQKEIYLSPGSDGILNYKVNDKPVAIETTMYEQVKLGNFVLGDYQFDAQKEIEDEKINGELVINMSESDVAVEKFDEDKIAEFQERSQERQELVQEEQEERRTIDTSSRDFLNSYMSKDKTDGYNDIEIGMDKTEVEQLLGDESDLVDPDNDNLLKYGNMGIEYKDDKVEQIYIIPNPYDVATKDEAEEAWQPNDWNGEMNGDSVQVIDNDRKGNNFAILIVYDNDDNIKYIFQQKQTKDDPWVE